MAGLTSMQRIEFVVHGQARPAGSKATYPVLNESGEVVRTKTGRLLTRAKHANPKTADWQNRVAQRAREVYSGPLLLGPLQFTLVFVRARPKSHFGTGKNEGKLKDSAPAYPISRPDLVKLARAVEDACNGVLWRDDSQIVREHLSKDYGEYYHLRLKVEQIQGDG